MKIPRPKAEDFCLRFYHDRIAHDESFSDVHLFSSIVSVRESGAGSDVGQRFIVKGGVNDANTDDFFVVTAQVPAGHAIVSEQES